MPTLRNSKHERYAQELAKGKTADEAYQLAGYKANRGNAARLKANESISDRVTELSEKIATRTVERTAITKEWISGKLVENLERSMQARRVCGEDGAETGNYTYQGSVANKSLELLARLHGHMVDKKEVGRPGDFSGLSDDELASQISTLEQAGAGSAAGPEAGSADKVGSARVRGKSRDLLLGADMSSSPDRSMSITVASMRSAIISKRFQRGASRDPPKFLQMKPKPGVVSRRARQIAGTKSCD
jgi:hypothetical protein